MRDREPNLEAAQPGKRPSVAPQNFSRKTPGSPLDSDPLWVLDPAPQTPAAAASRTWGELPLHSPEWIPCGACFPLAGISGSAAGVWLCLYLRRQTGWEDEPSVVGDRFLKCGDSAVPRKDVKGHEKYGVCPSQFLRTWSTYYGSFGSSEASICSNQVRQCRAPLHPQYSSSSTLIPADTSLWRAKPYWSRLCSIKNYA